MNRLIQKQILTAFLAAVSVVLCLCSCGKKTAVEQLQESMVQTQKRLPMVIDEDLTWVKAGYDKAANEILFEYSSRMNHILGAEELRLLHEMMVGQILPAFESDGPQMVSILRKLRPKVHYIYRWEGDDHIWLDDTCLADEYL